jgi:tetratricopeptide (TPR) repeat protein
MATVNVSRFFRRSTCLAIAAGSLCFAPGAEAQSSQAQAWADSARRVVDRAAARADTSGLSAARVLLDRALAVYPNDPLLLHYQGYTLFRAAGAVPGQPGPEQRQRLEAAEGFLARSAAARPLPETFAVRALLRGMMIAAEPQRAMSLGQEAGQMMARAVELGPTNPRVLLLQGIITSSTPEQWGGGVKKGEEQLRAALRAFEQDRPAPAHPAWGRAEAHAWLGSLLRQQGRNEEAQEQIAAALALEPENALARSLTAAPRTDAARPQR